jgi:lipoprotein-anchoring transpeptidase ErfK/SrfK
MAAEHQTLIPLSEMKKRQAAQGSADPDAAPDQQPAGTQQSQERGSAQATSGSGGGKPFSAAEIDNATYDGGTLPDGSTPLGAKLQVLLDRAGISPGVVDGWKGGMTESALRAFEAQQGLPVDGVLDPDVWAALGGDSAGAITTQYTITQEDAQGLSAPLPEDYAKLAKLDHLGFTSVAEKLAERFHMDEEFLEKLNPGAAFQPGETIAVVEPGPKAEGKVARIEIDKQTQRLRAMDAQGRMLVNYPVTVGSATTPSPSGTVEVLAVAPEPTYTYNPENFKQGDNDEVLILPPGPNGPVGSTWIDLSKPTYGIHGTAEPASLFKAASHGCVRLTNWDAEELSLMVEKGTTVVFKD